jgi:hypothetical protein
MGVSPRTIAPDRGGTFPKGKPVAGLRSARATRSEKPLASVTTTVGMSQINVIGFISLYGSWRLCGRWLMNGWGWMRL